MTQPNFYITTAISYPNGVPHIGHAYEAVATDAIARFKRIDGYDVFFLTGTDEHGLKMTQTAAKEGLAPRALCGSQHADLRGHVRQARRSRATASSAPPSPPITKPPRNCGGACRRPGDIYLDTYAGWYSVRDEAFYDESETVLGDDGVRLRSARNARSNGRRSRPISSASPPIRTGSCGITRQTPDFIGPETRRNEVVSFVKGGLQDLSISRTTLHLGRAGARCARPRDVCLGRRAHELHHGVGFPDENAPQLALLAGRFPHHRQGHRPLPRGLLAGLPDVGRASPFPKRVFGHGFLFNRGEKMSKSVGNVIDPFALADAYGVDQLRYFFLREVAFGQDGSYSHEAIVNRINADLANDLGNLAQRSLVDDCPQLRRRVSRRHPTSVGSGCGAARQADALPRALAPPWIGSRSMSR